jgi:4-alpha-glucanotransferase
MKFKRAAGILLHPTSLAGEGGIGDLGPSAQGWLDFLARSGCGMWQVLPLGPTGYGDSPYQCFSSIAGNPYLVSPQALLDEGLLHAEDLAVQPDFSPDHVDYGKVIPWKLALLERAYQRYENKTPNRIETAFKTFRRAQVSWLEDYALFMALKEAHEGASWTKWEPALRDHQPVALENARQFLKREIDRQAFYQFLFDRQWSALHARAAGSGIRIIGDVPIFIAHDSSDVWANPELFYLDDNRNPLVVAGVPPDYFAKTGQLWGNPLYRWKEHSRQGYAWWIERLRATLKRVDIIRMDHFRGFAGYWEVPGGAQTAEHGRWVPGPGVRFFHAVQNALGELPVIAEDLGVITPDVVALREKFDFPGMKILQFAFDGKPDNPFLPHNHTENCVVYTGTHDNDTARGWYERVEEAEKGFYRRYFDRDGSHFAWDLIRAAWASVAIFALAPMQDFLDLSNEARLNYPGSLGGNWSWRMGAEALCESLEKRIREMNFIYSRLNSQPDSSVMNGKK